ncbi:MAG: HIT domain-containing protein [Calditrichia bacterium]
MENLWAPWRMEYIEQAANGSGEQGCIFCNRLEQSDDEKNLILFRGKNAFVIMNRFPYNNGHLMVVPNRHTGELTEVNPDEAAEMFKLVQLCLQALRKTMSPHGFNVGMNLGRVAGAGIEDHLHYHIVPRWNGDTNFMPVLGNTKVISESLEKSYGKLHRALKELKEESGK